MENHTNTELYFHPSDNSSAIFGTSSDAIVEGLHNRDFVDQNDPASTLNADDDPNKIVNTQDQNEIVNPVEKDYKEDASNDPTPVSSEKPKEKKIFWTIMIYWKNKTFQKSQLHQKAQIK